MHGNIRAVLFLFLAMLVAGPAAAATLSVSPVSFDIIAPRNTAKLSVENRGEDPVAVQIRVLRWEKKDGKDNLIPTKDVVASPPMATLKPKSKYTVRIVRAAKQPVTSEESYRLLVDQLPKLAKQSGSRVSFLIRQSIPVFFTTAELQNASLAWSARIEGQKLVLMAQNKGGRRAQLSRIRLKSPAGAFIGAQEGLAGYLLAGSTTQWVQPVPKGLAPGAKITILAQDEYGPVEATAVIGAAD
jgi:fimbrial chaperone protein